MKNFQSRGLLMARASGQNPAVFADLTTAFAEFKSRHQAEVSELRQNMDDVFARLSSGGPALQPVAVGNRIEERNAIAHYARFGEMPKAGLSITGAGGGDLTQGGAAVFPAISNTIMIRQFAQSAIARFARRVPMEAGKEFQEPQDLGEIGGSWVTETAARPETTNPTFNLLTVPLDEVYALQKITQRMIDDSNYDLGAWVEGRIADKLSRVLASALASGDGVNKPRGLTNYPRSLAADSTRPWLTVQAKVTGVSAGFAASNPQDILVQTVYSLAAHFRPNARWLMSSNTASAIRIMKDTTGRYLWADPIAAGQPPTLLGHPVELDEYIPDIAAGSASIWFGDIEQAYCIVERPGLRFLRDPFTSKPDMVFYTYQRVGGRLQNSDAIKTIVFGTTP
jgi:HK97 family phage major capsid protein